MLALLSIVAGILQLIIPGQETVLRDGTLTVVHHPGIEVGHAVVGQLLNILVQTYATICWTLLYFDLRIRKEGYDLELAAREHAAIVS